jgi:hypothetical protein
MTLSRNHKIGDQVIGLRLAMMNLGLEGYEVLETHTKASNEQASILIDRPYVCEDAQMQDVANKRFGFCVRWGARVYWECKE